MIHYDTIVSHDPCMVSAHVVLHGLVHLQPALRHCFPDGLRADESLQDLPRPIQMSLSEDPATARGLQMLLRLLNQWNASLRQMLIEYSSSKWTQDWQLANALGLDFSVPRGLPNSVQTIRDIAGTSCCRAKKSRDTAATLQWFAVTFNGSEASISVKSLMLFLSLRCWLWSRTFGVSLARLCVLVIVHAGCSIEDAMRHAIAMVAVERRSPWWTMLDHLIIYIYISIYLSIYLPIYLSIYLSIYLLFIPLIPIFFKVWMVPGGGGCLAQLWDME